MNNRRELVSGAVLLSVLAAASVLLSLAGVKIDDARDRAVEAAWIARIEGVVDADYDNDLYGSLRSSPNEVLFGTSTAARHWTLLRGDGVVGHAIEVPVPEGYGGEMGVLVGIGADGRITAVDVPEHSETPSYGGQVIASVRFLSSFAGRDGGEDSALWRVAPGEGAVDGVSGATITKTAVTNGVLRALRHYDAVAAPSRNENEPASGDE
jgi:Na+-translocating ferredoxin:NAD+ oxidoreductase subunit G